MDLLQRPRVADSPAGKITLPKPSRRGVVSLEEALSRRRSMREFRDKPLTEDQIGQLLWATQGITDPQGFRAAPSAGALYALELYVSMAKGLYWYIPDSHWLECKSTADLRRELYSASEQDAILRAGAVFVITVTYSRLAEKYGEERSIRYGHLEAGHAAQNLLLQATALGLAAVPIGAFRDEEVQSALSLPSEQIPVYLIPVGVGFEERPAHF